MNSCSHCSHDLLRHLRSRNLYWYCPHCRPKTSELFVAVQNRQISRRSQQISNPNFWRCLLSNARQNITARSCKL